MKQNTTAEFYKVLFNDDEYTCFGENQYAKKTYHAHRTGVKEQNELFTINPLKKGSTRLDSNVEVYRNLLFEIDEYEPEVPGEKGDPVPLDIQATIVHRSGLPYSTCVNSGGKSLHWIVSVDDPFVDSKVEIESLWKAIAYVLNRSAKELGYNIQFDNATKNPSRLSRAPGAVRIKKDGENKIQKVQRVKSRIAGIDLLNWLESNGVNWYDYMPKRVEYSDSNDYNLDASTDEKIEYVLKHMLKNQVYEDGKNNWQFKFVRCLKNTGLSPNQCRDAVLRQCGVIDSRLDIDAIFSRYNDDEKIYVWSKADKIAWAREQERLEMARNGIVTEPGMTTPTLTLPDGEEVEVPYDNNLNNYALIGSDIFLIYPDNKREKYNLQGFKARFPSRDITPANIPNRFSGFGYYPDYFNTRKKLEYNKYNLFELPNVKPKKGPYPMTQKLIKHMYGEDKYELALELHWVWRHRPTQPTPGCAFPGEEDAGKTTYVDWLAMVYGNVNTIAMASLGKEENAYVKNCQFIVLEESSSKAMKNITPQEVVDKLKPLVTQTGKKVPIKELYSNGTETDYTGHVIILSNDPAPIKMQGESTRWWVNFIYKPEKNEDFVKKLEEEVPAFLWFLDNEFKPSRTSSKERLWFHPDEYWTVDKERALTYSGSKLYKIIKSILLDFFEENPKEHLCYFDLKSMADIIKLDTSYTKYDIRDCLQEEFKWKSSDGRKTVTDSLDSTFSGQSVKPVRKMKYYVVNKDLKNHEEIEYGVADIGF